MGVNIYFGHYNTHILHTNILNHVRDHLLYHRFEITNFNLNIEIDSENTFKAFAYIIHVCTAESTSQQICLQAACFDANV